MSWVNDLQCAICGNMRPSVVWRCPSCNSSKPESTHGRVIYRGYKGQDKVIEYADGWEDVIEDWDWRL